MVLTTLRSIDLDMVDGSFSIFEYEGYMLDDTHLLRIEHDRINIFPVMQTDEKGVVIFDKRRKTVLDFVDNCDNDINKLIDLKEISEMKVMEFFKRFI